MAAPLVLRPYQEIVLSGVANLYRMNVRRVLMCSPTGSGKSAMTNYMLGRTKKRTLILVHRGELRDMIARSLTVPFGEIGSGRYAPNESVHLGMMQTVARRLDALPHYEWVISDEAHLAICPTWLRILQHYGDAWHLGMSATPCRLDGRGLGEHYDRIVYGPSIAELTARGFLVPCRVFAPPTKSAPRKSGSDFSMAAASEMFDDREITGSAVAHWRKHARGRKTITFCCDRQHAQHVADDFNAAGIPSVAIDGSMSEAEQKSRLSGYMSGRFVNLVNVELFTTGFDYPELSCLVMLRPTDSLALFLQMVGRGLRCADGKRDCILLDHVGNTKRHGMPEEPREWTLDGSVKRAKPPAVAQCPRCYAAHAPSSKCPACGYVHQGSMDAASRRAIKTVAGTLQEITSDRLAQLRTDPLDVLLRAARKHGEPAKIRAELELIGEARGFKAGFAQAQMTYAESYARRFKRRGT